MLLVRDPPQLTAAESSAQLRASRSAIGGALSSLETLGALAWVIGLVVVLVPLAMRAFRRA